MKTLSHDTAVSSIRPAALQSYSVGVFKTNIVSMANASLLAASISQHYPLLQINFDLEDCDHILRIAGPCVPPHIITTLAMKQGFEATLLSD